MALEEVLEDVSAKDAFSYILNNGDRSDKIDDIIKAVTPKIIKKLREMGPLKAEKYLQQKREQLEEMSDRDFIKSYKKYVEGQSEEEINKMFLKTIIVETGAIDISKLSDQQLDQLEKNFMDYLYYWNEKYYRNGFVDGSQIAMECFED